jgi:hypothetical protein
MNQTNSLLADLAKLIDRDPDAVKQALARRPKRTAGRSALSCV